MSVGTSSATLTVTVDQSPAEIAVQAVLSTASLEYDTTEWNGVLIADAIMTSVLTNDFVAEELDDFLQALYAAHFPGDAIVSAETVAVVEGFHGEQFHVSLEQAKKVKGLKVRRLAILCRTKQGRVFLHTEKHSEKDTLGGYESVPLQGDGAEHINAYVMHLAQLDPTISFDDDEDEYDEETISELQDYVHQASDLVAHEGLQAVVFAGKVLFKATKAGASIAGTVASAVALGAWGMAIGALEAESEPVTVGLQSSDEPGSSDSVTLAIGATIVTRKRNSPLVELIRSAEAFTASELLERLPEGQRVGEVSRPGVMRAETGTYRASSRNVRVDPRLWRSLRWIDVGGADIYQPFRKYFENRIGKDGAIVKLDRQEFERIMREAVENPDRGFFGFKTDPIEKYAAKEIEHVLDRLINNLDANVVLTVNERVYAPNPHDPYAYLLEEFHDMLRFTLGFTTRRLEEAFGVVNIIHRYEHDPANRDEQSEKIDNASLHPIFRTKDNQTLGKDFKDPNKWASFEALKVVRSAHVWGPGRSLRYKGAPEYVVEDRIRIRSHSADFETWRDVTPEHAFVTLPDDRLKAQPVSADRRERLIKNMLYANKHKQVSGDGMPTDLRVNTVVAVERRGSVNRAMKRSQGDASGEERVEERPQQEDVRMYYVPYASLDRQEDFIVDAVHEFINTYVGFTTQEFDEALSDALQIRRSAKHLLPARLHPNFLLSGERVADGGAQADDVRDRFLDKYDPQRLGERSGTTEQRPGTIRKVAQGGIRAVKKVGQKLFHAQQSAAAKETHRYDELHVLGIKPDTDDDEFRAFSGAGTRVDKGRAGQEETIKDQFLTNIKAQRTQAVPVAAPVPRTRRSISLVKYAERNHAAAVELTEQRAERERKLLELRTLFKDRVRRTKSVWPAEALVRRLEQVHYVIFDNNAVYKHESDDDCSLFAGDVPSGGIDYKCVLHKTPKAYHCTQTE